MVSRMSEAPAGRRRLDRKLVTIGGAGGLLSGLLGVGGGLIMVPLLVLWAGYGQRDAHAMSLAAIIPISLASVIAFGAAGEVRVGYAVALSLGSIAGARVGVGLLARIDERALKVAFGLFLAAASILLVVR